jgi:LytR_cpsA_psr family/LytR cell envelope-related transcriptional attenuator
VSGRHRKSGPPADATEPPASVAVSVGAPPALVAASDGQRQGPHAGAATLEMAPPTTRTEVALGPAPAAGTGAATEAVPLLPANPGAAPGRRAQRELERRKLQRVRLLTIGVACVVVVAVVAAFVLRGSGNRAPGAASAVSSRPQTTVLLSVLGPQNQTIVAALLAHTSKGQHVGFGALLPRNLEVTVPGSGTTTLGNASSVGGTTGSTDAVADAMGVIVDGSWNLTGAGLASLVSAVGGVTVNVDRNVVTTAGGTSSVVIPAGPHSLTGPQASLYATYLAGSEPEQARLARLSLVLQALMAKLPASETVEATTLRSLGHASTSTLTSAQLAGFLADLHSDSVNGQLSFNDVPTNALDPGSGSTVASITQSQISSFVQANFGGSLPPVLAGGPIRVLVQNGVGTPGLGLTARDRLVQAGLTYVAGGNAGQFGYTTSLILISNTSSKALGQGRTTAHALRLPVSDIRLNPSGQSVADVIVILGADYKP